jgi:hypothetical protein
MLCRYLYRDYHAFYLNQRPIGCHASFLSEVGFEITVKLTLKLTVLSRRNHTEEIRWGDNATD